MLSARAHFVAKLQADGPFDGVMASSDGGALATSVMIHDAELDYKDRATTESAPNSQHFRFAILISSFPPFDATGQKRLDKKLAGRSLIHCPSIHIVGNLDPFRSLATMTKELCDTDKVTFVGWDGMHETPSWSAQGVCKDVASHLKAMWIQNEGDGDAET